MPEQTFQIPSQLAIALNTGRPELARLQNVSQHDIEQINEYTVALVKEILAERQIVQVIHESMRQAIELTTGALNYFARIQNAIELMGEGREPQLIIDALENETAEKKRRKREALDIGYCRKI